MLPITDLNGKQEFITNIKVLNRKRKVNGEKLLAFSVIPSNSNAHSFSMVDVESIVEFEGEEYVIKVVNEINIGAKTVKNVEAVHRFFNDMINSQQHNLHTGSMTFHAALTHVFDGSGYSFHIIGNFLAQRFENFGRTNRLSMFKRVLERYNAEFNVIGDQVYLRHEVGQKTDFQFRYGHNTKTIDFQRDTRKLATRIKGYGGSPDDDGNYPIVEEYVSANTEFIGDLEADPVINENLSTVEGMRTRLQKVLIDEPQLSITIAFEDLRATGYLYNYPNEGDYGFIIYEPMNDLQMEARIVEIDEEFDYNLKPIKTNVTLSNIRNSITDVMTRFQQTSKTVDRIINGQEKLPFSVLDDAVKRATKDLQNTQTELEFVNGIIARSKVNPNHLVLFNSGGIGVSVDGGQTFKTAMTGEGIVADLITVGTMLFDRIQGGILRLGGYENTNGVMQVYNSEGEVIADLDGDRGGFSDLFVGSLRSENIQAPNVPEFGSRNLTFYVRGSQGDDNNTGTGGWEDAFYSIQRAIDSIPKIYDGVCEILVSNLYDINENIEFKGMSGGGTVTLDLRGNTINGRIEAISNNLWISVINGRINREGGAWIVQNSTSQYFRLDNLIINGNNTQTHGVRTWRGGQTYITNCEIYNVEECITGSSASYTFLTECKGLGSTRGINMLYGSRCYGYGAAPAGMNVNFRTALGGVLHGSWTPDSGNATPPSPPTVEVTEVFNPTSAGNWRENFGGQWNSNNTYPYQGKWDTWGLYYGLWFFGDNIRNKVNGKNIKRIRIRPHRRSEGGSSSSVDVVFRTHNHSTRPNGEPTVSSHTHTVSFSWGERKWVTLPQVFLNAFASGSARGIAIYTTNTSNNRYAIFNTSLEVEITYE